MTIRRRSLWALVFAVTAFASLVTLSFVATPVKFLAQEVPIAHLLAVGRVTFRASLGVEIALLAALVITATGQVRWLTCCAAAALAFQWLALMPELDERTLARMASSVLAPSSLHQWWIVLDVVKLSIYALISGIVGRNLLRIETLTERTVQNK